MRKTIFVAAGIILLLLAIGFITRDLFFPKAAPLAGKDAIDSLKASGEKVLYRSLFSFQPEMEELKGVVAGNDDRIYVCGNNAVEIFDMRGKPVAGVKIPGTAVCIALDQLQNIYLGMNDQLLIMDPSGKKINSWKKPDTGTLITSIAAGRNIVIFADAGLRTVFVYDHSGNRIRRIGDEDPAKKIPGFIVPSPYFDVFLTKDDSLWVANTGRHELEKYALTGEMVQKWGIAGMTPDAFCGCCNPCNFTILSDGSFVTAEKGIPRVKLYSATGEFLGMVAVPDDFEEGTRGIDVAADLHDRIIILDPVKKKITVYVRS